MERRQSQRQQAERNVTVYSYGVLVAVGTTTNLSEHGAYIRLKDDVSGGVLRPGSAAKIVFNDEDPIQHPHGTPAKVAHQGVDGIGLIFLESTDVTG